MFGTGIARRSEMLEEREREFLTTRACKADEGSALRALGLPLVGPEEWLKTQKGEVYLTKPGLLMEDAEKPQSTQRIDVMMPKRLGSRL
jgi:hypothetical protein